jgi:hypothetical protein
MHKARSIAPEQKLTEFLSAGQIVKSVFVLPTLGNFPSQTVIFPRIYLNAPHAKAPRRHPCYRTVV